MRNRSLLLLTMLLLAIGILPAAPVGSIKGYIRDATGAPVPNASVQVKNEQTNVTQDGKSDNTGLYQFLGPGSGCILDFRGDRRFPESAGQVGKRPR